MTFFARGANCGDRAVRGDLMPEGPMAAADLLSNAVNARLPNPPAVCRNMSRRVVNVRRFI